MYECVENAIRSFLNNVKTIYTQHMVTIDYLMIMAQ